MEQPVVGQTELPANRELAGEGLLGRLARLLSPTRNQGGARGDCGRLPGGPLLNL